jgi:hypothetical protein
MKRLMHRSNLTVYSMPIRFSPNLPHERNGADIVMLASAVAWEGRRVVVDFAGAACGTKHDAHVASVCFVARAAGVSSNNESAAVRVIRIDRKTPAACATALMRPSYWIADDGVVINSAALRIAAVCAAHVIVIKDAALCQRRDLVLSCAGAAAYGRCRYQPDKHESIRPSVRLTIRCPPAECFIFVWSKSHQPTGR